MFVTRSRDPGERVRFPAGGLGVAFFATGPSWVLNVYLHDTQIYLTLKILHLLTTGINLIYPLHEK